MTRPLVYLALYNAETGGYPISHKYYVENYAQPILIKENEYTAGKYKIVVKYNWFGSPVRDYTVSIYSKQDIEIRNE